MKSLFNFYLDDNVKVKAQNKLDRVMGKREKGQLASLLRVLLNDFVETDDKDLSDDIKHKIEQEYQYTLLKNKRSKN